MTDIDVQTFRPVNLQRRSSRAMLRLLEPRLVSEYNALVRTVAKSIKPDFVLAFKGPLLTSATLRELRRTGAALYNFYPDPSPFSHDKYIPEALPEYDCVFYTKSYWKDRVLDQLKLHHAIFLPHGYDAELHQRWRLSERDRQQFTHDVLVVATYTSHKERVLHDFVSLMPSVDLQIWGNQWNERCSSKKVRPFLQGAALVGSSYSRALQAARINFAIMGGVFKGVDQGDNVTTRTFEIPACGGFMLHERNEELLEYFNEGTEVACFGSAEELGSKVQHYLSHPMEREAIAKAGHQRCVPAYSYDNRMAEILSWHSRNRSPCRISSSG